MSQIQREFDESFTVASRALFIKYRKTKRRDFGRFQSDRFLPSTFVGEYTANDSWFWSRQCFHQSYFSEYSGRLDKEYHGFKIWGIQYTATILDMDFWV